MPVVELRSSKRQRRQERRGNNSEVERGLYLKRIDPLTDNQELTFEEFAKENNLLLHGSAGTGKTFISLYLALMEIMNGHTDMNKVVLIRSVVPTRDMGFLPGSVKDKAKVYEAPYQSICNELFGRGDAYEILKGKSTVEFQTTSFVRGITFNNCIVIVDEMQNMTYQELDSVITRIGDNCKIIFCGDFKQTDLLKDSEKNGLLNFMKVLKRMNLFSHIEFTRDDIVRSKLVKSYIVAKEELNIFS